MSAAARSMALAAIASLVFTVSIHDAAADSCLEGTGISVDPFLVSSAADLAKVGSGAGGCSLSAVYELVSDIALDEPAAGSSNHSPIGTQEVPFTGTFDGGGFAISGLVMVAGSNSWGLFGGTDGAAIRNVHIIDGVLTTTKFSNLGLLIGHSTGSTVARSSASGSVAGFGSFGGGLIGYVSGTSTIANSFTAVSVQGGSRAGGLIGGDWAYIVDSYASGSVRGNGELGGLVGRRARRITTSYAVGPVTGNSNTGGLVGGGLTEAAFDSFWDVSETGQETSPNGGTGKSTAEMTEGATFRDTTTDGLVTAWKISDGWVPYVEDVYVWGICRAVNDGRPFLLWQFDSDPCAVTASVENGSTAGSVHQSVALAVELATATGVAGTSSSIIVRDGVRTPSSSAVSRSIGRRGGVVVDAEGLRVALASTGGAAASSGVVVTPGAALEVSIVSDLVPGSVVEAWGYSTPRLLGAVRVPNGFAPGDAVLLPVPTGAPLDGGAPLDAGAHVLQLRMETASGLEVLATGMTVVGPVPSSVPTGEGPQPPALQWWLLLAFAFGVLVALGVRPGWPGLRVR